MKKSLAFVIGTGLALSMMVLSGTVAGIGAGACAAGIGFSLEDPETEGPYAGANIGTASETGVFDNAADYQAACCAETGEAPDCFEEVEG